MPLNNPKYCIAIVCIGYSKYLDASLFYWDKMNYDNYQIVVATIEKDAKTIQCLSGHKNISLFMVRSDFHNKSKILKNIYDLYKNDFDYFVFSDADILFFRNILNDLTLRNKVNPDLIISSKREDISKNDIDLFFDNYKSNPDVWVWDNITRTIFSPSPFMGWFLCCPMKSLEHIIWPKNHIGYDQIDHDIYSKLNKLCESRLIYCDNPPLHLYHGEKGSNWKGLDITKLCQ